MYKRQVVTVINEPGALGAIATVIGENGANIDTVNIIVRSPDFRELILDIEVWDLKHLNSILSQLRAKSVVSTVERVNG